MPDDQRPCIAARPPFHSSMSLRKAAASEEDHRPISSTVASRSRWMTRVSPFAWGSTTAGSVCTYSRPHRDDRPSSSSASNGFDWMSTWADEHESWAKPGSVNSSVTVLPPMSGRASRTRTCSPASAR
jgi:hypothetical protein